VEGIKLQLRDDELRHAGAVKESSKRVYALRKELEEEQAEIRRVDLDCQALI
jgi:hypothetical protein